MTPPIRCAQAAPDAVLAMPAMQDHVGSTELEHSLVELVRLAASCTNGCACCVDTHATEARAHVGEVERVRLSMAVIAIDGRNRIAVASRAEVGTYGPRALAS